MCIIGRMQIKECHQIKQINISTIYHRKKYKDERKMFPQHTRNTDLKPMPFFPMYPVLDPFFVEFPTSQSALIF